MSTIVTESLIIGIVYFVLTIIGVIWLFCLKGIFRNQIYLQRQLFIFIILTCITRGLQHAEINQFCGRLAQPPPPLCHPVGDRFNMSFDLLASAYNFTIYLILCSFWAEQYYSIKNFTFEGHMDSVSTFKNIRKKINMVFYALLLLAYGLVLLFMLVVLIINPGWRDTWWLIGRLVIRILLSLSITIGLSIYGYKVHKSFKIQFNTKQSLLKVSIISFVCGASYFCLSGANVITFTIDTLANNAFSFWPYAWIFFNLFSAIEITANGLLLLSLTPKSIQGLFLKVCCFACMKKQRKRSGSATHLANPSDEETHYDGTVDEPETNDSGFYSFANKFSSNFGTLDEDEDEYEAEVQSRARAATIHPGVQHDLRQPLSDHDQLQFTKQPEIPAQYYTQQL